MQDVKTVRRIEDSLTNKKGTGRMTGPLFIMQRCYFYISVTVIACCGQFSTQVWQLMHSDMFTGSAFPPSILKTDCGHTFAQVPSPSHLPLSTVTMYMVPRSSLG